MHTLQEYGWDAHYQEAWAQLDLPHCVPGRVIADYGNHLKVATPAEQTAEIAGKLSHFAESHNLPKVGDWVAVQLSDTNQSVVQAVLPRKSEISRKLAGEKVAKQILATNVDKAFVVQSLDNDFSPARLERYAYQLHQSHIDVVFIFNKADKILDIVDKQREIEALGLPFIITSTITGQGIEAIRNAIPVGQTAVFLGSSGVGKSTLTNKLLGLEQQKTAEVRESDSTGRHTTSHREIFILPHGGLLIDTPGIRELQLWGDEESLEESFPDIIELATGCKFRSSCSHTKEPGCAVLKAIRKGKLAPQRLEQYHTFQHELQELAKKCYGYSK